MSFFIVDGPTRSGRKRSDSVSRSYGRDSRGRFLPGFTANGRWAAQDRALYHPDNPKDYGSTVGIMDNDGNTFCVGCYWCEGPWTEYHTLIHGHDANHWPDRDRAAA